MHDFHVHDPCKKAKKAKILESEESYHAYAASRMELYLYTFLTNFDTQFFFQRAKRRVLPSVGQPRFGTQRGGPVLFCIGHQHDRGGHIFLPMEKLTTGDHRQMLPIPVKMISP